MRAAGRIDAHQLEEIEGCVRMWVNAETDYVVHMEAGGCFRIAVTLAASLCSERGQRSMTEGSFDERHKFLSELVRDVVGDTPATVLTDLLWMLLKPTPRGGTAHQLIRAPAASATAQYCTYLRSSSFPRSRHLHIVHFLESDEPKARVGNDLAVSRNTRYLCLKGHEFSTQPARFRRAGHSDGCSVCSGRVPTAGANTLGDLYPELANEFDSVANAPLTVFDITPGTARSVMWLCPEGHSYAAKVNQRLGGRTGCPYCTRRKPLVGYNTLQDRLPGVAKWWDSERNGERTPTSVTAGSKIAVWWKCDRGHSFKQAIADRARGRGCGVCAGRVLHETTSLAATRPDVARYWHRSRNGKLTAKDVPARSGRRVWWQCPEGHEWQTSVTHRVSAPGYGCPYCANRLVSSSNSLAAVRPDLARELDETKMAGLTASDVLATSQQHHWWVCRAGHEWAATPYRRVRFNQTCALCKKSKRLEEGTLASRAPEIAAEIDASKNGLDTAREVLVSSKTRLWWRCASGHSWQGSVNDRVRRRSGCPYCSNRRVGQSNCMATTHPELAAELDPELNPADIAQRVVAGTSLKLWWVCPSQHRWRSSGDMRLRQGATCPACRGHKSAKRRTRP